MPTISTRTGVNTDKLRKSVRRWTGTLLNSIDNSTDVSVTLNVGDCRDFPDDTAVDIVVDRVDASGNVTLGKEEVLTCVHSAGTDNLLNCKRAIEGNNGAHAAGSIVEMRLTAAQWNDVMDHLLIEHNQDGTHGHITSTGDITATDITATGVIRGSSLEDTDIGAGSVITDSADIDAVMNKIYPLGSIYMSILNTDPGTLFGGTWDTYSEGRTLIGVDPSDTDYDAVGNTGGNKTHTNSVDEMALHKHQVASHNHSDGSLATNTTGGHQHEYHGHRFGGTKTRTHLSMAEAATNYDDYVDMGILTTGGANGSHKHAISGSTGYATPYTDNQGATTPYDIRGPYITTYMWKRTGLA